MNPALSVVPDGVLAYGMQLPVQALSVRVSMPWEQEGTVDDMVQVAQACDEAGFLYVAVCHHVAIPREPAEMMSTQWFDPIATLAYLGAHGARRLFTNVFVAAYQHPLATATGVRHARPALERPHDRGARRRPRRGRVRRWKYPSRAEARSLTAPSP
jgi:hypothetical protein